MTKYVYIKSAAHAESMGIKYVDGIVGAVIEKKAEPPYRVVGFSQGYSFNPKNVRLAPTKTYDAYVSGELYKYFNAVSPAVARILAKEDLRAGTRFTLYEREIKRRKV